MLIQMRSRGATWATRILLGLMLLLLIPSFIIWGFYGRAPESQHEAEVATVGSVEISAAQLSQSVERETRRMQLQAGGPLDPQLLRQLGVVDRALDQLIELAAFSSYGGKLGMARVDDAATTDMARTAIQTNPAFQGTAGGFDPNRYESFLRDAGLSEDGYLKQLRQVLVAAPIAVAIRTGVQAPEAMAQTIYAYRNEQRVAQSVVIPDTSITDVPTPDDAAITQFHKDHAASYQAPEYRAVTVVRLRPEDRVASIKVSDDQVKAEYDARKSEFDVPAQRQISQAVIPDEAAAKDLVSKVRAGTPFADALKTAANTDPLDLGNFGKAEDLQNALSSVVEDAATAKGLADSLLAAKEGDVTDPIKGPLGWVIFNVAKAEDAHVQTLAEVHDKLVHDVALHQAVSDMVGIANQLQDEMGGGAKLADAAAKLELPVQKIEAVDKSGKAPDGSDVASVKDDAQTLSLTFDTPEGEDSALTDAADGGFVIVHVDGVRPAATRPLAEVRDKVIADWQEAERQKAVGVQAQKIVERIQGGEAIDKIAAELNTTVATSQPFKRDAGDPTANISQGLATKLFAGKVGDAASDRSATDDGEVVAILSEIKPADLAAAKDDVAAVRKSLGNAIGGDIYDQFSAAIQEEIGVSKDQAAIDQLYP